MHRAAHACVVPRRWHPGLGIAHVPSSFRRLARRACPSASGGIQEPPLEVQMLSRFVQKRYDVLARTELAPVPRGLLLAWERVATRRLRRHRHAPAASWKGHCAFGSARCSSWSTQAFICDTSCCLGANPDRATPIDAAIAGREAVAAGWRGEHVSGLGNVRGRGAGRSAAAGSSGHRDARGLRERGLVPSRRW